MRDLAGSLEPFPPARDPLQTARGGPALQRVVLSVLNTPPKPHSASQGRGGVARRSDKLTLKTEVKRRVMVARRLVLSLFAIRNDPDRWITLFVILVGGPIIGYAVPTAGLLLYGALH